MKKYSVSLHGHATSISLEPEFWQQICHIAATRGQSVASLISEIDDSRDPQRGRAFRDASVICTGISVAKTAGE